MTWDVHNNDKYIVRNTNKQSTIGCSLWQCQSPKAADAISAANCSPFEVKREKTCKNFMVRLCSRAFMSSSAPVSLTVFAHCKTAGSCHREAWGKSHPMKLNITGKKTIFITSGATREFPTDFYLLQLIAMYLQELLIAFLNLKLHVTDVAAEWIGGFTAC